jgi:aspartate carbamoyltransferase regulatory subunit
MTTTNSNGKAVTEKKIFSRFTSVSIDINSDKNIIWALLTNAEDFPRWNSTLISLTGNIAKGEKIKLVSKLAPNRTFNLKVKEFEIGSKLVWGDAMGERVYTILENGNNNCKFTMLEKIGGPLFPLFSSMIPSFDEAFEQFSLDLKNEAELISKTK